MYLQISDPCKNLTTCEKSILEPTQKRLPCRTVEDQGNILLSYVHVLRKSKQKICVEVIIPDKNFVWCAVCTGLYTSHVFVHCTVRDLYSADKSNRQLQTVQYSTWHARTCCIASTQADSLFRLAMPPETNDLSAQYAYIPYTHYTVCSTTCTSIYTYAR